MPEGKGQFKQMKKAGIRDYLLSMKEAGIISPRKTDQLMADNESKQERLRNYRLPTFTTWGPTESLTETTKLIPESQKTPGHRFLVRCAPKNLQSNLKIERTMNITWPEIGVFVRQLPGGEENYTVEIREHWNADYGGAIIANGAGKIIAEIAEGNLAELENKDSRDIKNAQIDLGVGDIHFKYSENTSLPEKEIMIGALKYFTPTVTREGLEKLKIYTEFAYSKEHGYKFFEASNEDFWTNI
ncbi:MAG: hypothetical protein WCT44_00955 [Candidatus Paceibacterota bacterium]